MSWINRSFFSFFVIIFSSFFALVLIEICLRLFSYGDDWVKIKEANVLRNFQFKYSINNLYEHDTSSVDYVRNEYGLRDSCKSPKEIDILTIGGSTTDQRYVPFESTFQVVLERRMSEELDSFGCITNAGVDGHSTLGHIFSFNHWFPLIPNLNPKFILLYVGVNDANFTRALNRPKKLISGSENKNTDNIKTFLKNFAIVQALLPIYRLLKTLPVNSVPAYAEHKPRLYNLDDYKVLKLNKLTAALSRENTNAFKSRMIILLKKIKDLNSIPICVTQPHRYVMKKKGKVYGIPNIFGRGFSGIDYDYSIRQLNSVILELCGENTLDLYNQKFLNSHFYDGVHTTALGSEAIGDRMADFIITKYY